MLLLLSVLCIMNSFLYYLTVMIFRVVAIGGLELGSFIFPCEAYPGLAADWLYGWNDTSAPPAGGYVYPYIAISEESKEFTRSS